MAMTPEKQRAALAKITPPMWLIFKPIYGQTGYYRENASGYTSIKDAWRVTEEVGRKKVSGRPTDNDRVVLVPAPLPDYLNDRNAIYALLEQIEDSEWDEFAELLDYVTYKENRRPHQRRKDIFTASCGQLCRAFLEFKGLWEETE